MEVDEPWYSKMSVVKLEIDQHRENVLGFPYKNNRRFACETLIEDWMDEMVVRCKYDLETVDEMFTG